MSSLPFVRMAFIGCGGMARYHLRVILEHHSDTTKVAAICEPSLATYAEAAKIFEEAGLEPPPNEPDFEKFLATYQDQLDAVFIITPHVYHHNQTKACLESGLDVLLEKPMVINAVEARSLIETRDRTGKVLVVAFQGSLSPQIRTAVSMLRSGEVGPILNINGAIWQNWAAVSDGTWRQKFEISGGGFMFDTGAHMLNTVADLAGEDFVEVAAWVDNQGRDVEILAAVIGRLPSGALVTLNACGNTIKSCASEILVFCSKAILRLDAWGAPPFEIQRTEVEGWETVEVPLSRGVWEQFLAVRAGKIKNPSPPEVGLRMAYLWDAIKASAAQNGVPIRIDQLRA